MTASVIGTAAILAAARRGGRGVTRPRAPRFRLRRRGRAGSRPRGVPELRPRAARAVHRAAAATAARTGLPIIRPLLTDPEDPRGWAIADAYGFGPALWVAPVLDDGAREREVALPRGRWIETCSGAEVAGGGSRTARGSRGAAGGRGRPSGMCGSRRSARGA
ncbi:MAG TPA: hypothetical protein VG410_07855 [Solirubrobacteraceae bacterium]|nr:hypothetical protein [Solirubrobacteraceae bacterium]